MRRSQAVALGSVVFALVALGVSEAAAAIGADVGGVAGTQRIALVALGIRALRIRRDWAALASGVGGLARRCATSDARDQASKRAVQGGLAF